MDGLLALGRNVGAYPLSEPDWRTYIGEVHEAITVAGGTIHGTAIGTGEWLGLLEETAFVFFEGADETVLLADLPVVAKLFGQEAIGLLTGVAAVVVA